MRRVLYISGGVVAALLAAVLVGPGFIDWNRYKAEISGPITDLTGRSLAIDGDLRFSLLPTPVLSARGVRLANLPGAKHPEMIRLESLEIRVPFLSLLSGAVQVSSVTLVNPVIALEIMADGRANWELPAFASAESAEADDSAGAAVGFDKVSVKNATVLYRDNRDGTDEKIENLDATVSARSLEGPFSARGSVRLRGQTLGFEVQLGDITGGETIPASLTLDLENAGAELTFSGWVSEPALSGRLNGRLTVEGGSLADAAGALLALTGAGREGAVSAVPDRPFALESHASLDVEGVRLRDMSFRVGGETATGTLSVGYGEEPSFDGNFTIASVDLDTWLDTWLDNWPGDGEPGAAAGPAFSIPGNLTGALKVSIGGVNYRGGVVRRVELALAVKDGRIVVENVLASLPGGSDLGLSGTIRAADGAPRFDGRLRTTSDNLRGLLGWLDLGPNRIPADRLTRLEFAGALSVTPEIVQIYGAKLTLDNSSISGGISVGLGERPAYGVDLKIDRFNADAYFPPGENGGGPGLESLAGPFDGVDANLKLRIDDLTARGTSLGGLDIDASLVAGELTVRNASVENLAGAAIKLEGSAGGFSGDPVFDARLTLKAGDLGGLARLTGIALPSNPSSLGRALIEASYAGTLEGGTLALDGRLGGTGLRLAGSIQGPLTGPKLDFEFGLDAPGYAALARQFEFDVPVPAGPDDRPLTIEGKVAGGTGALRGDLSAKVAGGQLTIRGTVEDPFDGPAFDIALNIDHPDLTGLVRGLGVSFEPAARKLGGVKLSARLKGDAGAASVTELRGNLGPVSLSGSLEADLDGERPAVSAQIESSEIIADLFLPVATTGIPEKAGARRPARWSGKPLKLDLLREVDADINLTARGLVVRGYDFRSPRLRLVLKDGILEVPDLTARLFDGEAELSFRLDSRATPSLTLDLSLTNADLRQALTTSAGMKRISGRFGMSGSFTAAGRSQQEMISALNGQASISAQNGGLDGIDLVRLGDRLEKVAQLSDFVGVIASTLSGGSTRYRTARGTLVFENGVGRSRDVEVEIDAAAVETQAIFDLPNWNMDVKTRFWLKNHPQAPPLGIDYSGPIDAPRRDLRAAKLQAFMAKSMLGAVLRGAQGTGGGVLGTIFGLPPAGQAAPEPPAETRQEQPEQRKIRPEDLFKEFLKRATRPDDS